MLSSTSDRRSTTALISGSNDLNVGERDPPLRHLERLWVRTRSQRVAQLVLADRSRCRNQTRAREDSHLRRSRAWLDDLGQIESALRDHFENLGGR